MTTVSYVSFRTSKNGNPYAEFQAYTEAEGDIYLRSEDVDAVLSLRPVTADNYSRNLFPRKDGSVADIVTTRFRVDIEYTRSAGGFASITSARVHTAPQSAAFASLSALPAKQAAAKAAPAPAETASAEDDLG